jgi:hypothetical protein
MANTPIYGWETPDDTDYVYQGAAAIRTTSNSIDSTLSGLAQKWSSYVINTSSLIVASATETLFFTGSSFTPAANRIYSVTYSVGNIAKLTNAGTVFVSLRKTNAAGTLLDRGYMTNFAVFEESYFSKTLVLTSAQMGTTAFAPAVCIAGSTNGVFGENSSPSYGYGTILITDLGSY